jgi:hypothetical protein
VREWDEQIHQVVDLQEMILLDQQDVDKDHDDPSGPARKEVESW